MNAEITELLLSEAARINSPEFIAADPVQFPRRFLSSQPDAEIVSLLAAHIAWGNRKMICRDADRMLEMMDGQPPSTSKVTLGSGRGAEPRSP